MKVSVIIPCYNVEKYVADCIESVIKQDHDDLEIICVEDGSTDQSPHILADLQQKYPQIQLIHQANTGAPAARNRGLREAKGTYLQFLDADDLLLPQKISTQVKLAEENTLPSLIVGNFRKQDHSGSLLYKGIFEGSSQSPWILLMQTELGITSSNLFKASIVQEAGVWNEQLGSSQEYELMFKMMQVDDSIVFDGQSHTIIQQRESGSISQSEPASKWKRYIRLRTDILDYLKDEGINIELAIPLQVLFDAIRNLYKYDSQAAIEIHKQYIPRGFRPISSPGSSRAYIKMYRMLGFVGAEKARRLLRPNS